MLATTCQTIPLPAQTSGQDYTNEKISLLLLEQQWLAAELKMDTVFIASILDSSFMGISEYGIHSRQQEITDIFNTMQQRQKNNISIDTFEIEQGNVNLYTDAAVVTFVLRTYRNENGAPVQRRTRFYDVWIRKENRWMVVSSQGSIVKE